ncbi:MAG TPA: amidohydrolase/deacetylase family metallohydrolase [Candidatus Binatia bacterium]|nr:amidohydrolase/deacetylase family metallohydrolase [Candidatus Binatia bacterium]
MSDTFDLLLSGGTVLNPASGLCQELDVGIIDARIAAIQSKLPRDGAKKILDVRGCFVTPGLIDFHVHSYWGANPYGFNADPICLESGVTTAMDAGSAGPVNFLGFRKLVHEPSKTRMLAFVAVAQHGVLNDPGELQDLRFADPEGAAAKVEEFSHVGVGIKVRLHKKGVGDNGREALRLAIRAGDACRSPVMVHVGDTGISMEEIVDTLRAGDVVTHCYTPQKPSIVDPSGRLLVAVRKAQERGVIFDVGHAGGHFDFNLVRRAMADGLLPNVISSDLHGRLQQPGFGVVGDLPTVLTKFLALGLTLDQIVAMCTINPARVIGWQDRLGSLEVGREADVAVLQIVNEPMGLRDSVGGEMVAEQRIAARWTIRRGEVFQDAS